MTQPSLFDLEPEPEPESPPQRETAPAPALEPPPPDHAARTFAVAPENDVVLEASAGTGKTRVLVDRYVRLIEAGVDPRHVLAITFTRKAAAEMRGRVLAALQQRADEGALTAAVWQGLRDRISDIQISTIDAFCFGLLREFPLEADVDPAFEIADETEMARFANEALELTMRATRALLRDDERVRLLFAQVKQPVLRDALAGLIDRRHVAVPAVATFVERSGGPRTAVEAAQVFVGRIRGLLVGSPHRAAIQDDGPHGAPGFKWLHADLASLETFPADDPARVQQLRRRLERYFLTRSGEPRKKLSKPFTVEAFASPAAKKRHEAALQAVSSAIHDELAALETMVNGLLARGLQRVLAIAVDRYERLLEEHALLDFAGMLARSVALLERQEEFARSRLKLQSRYHHLLVDEFQDTSRLQWRLVELLVDAWGEGEGVADAPTSIFVVGDRKQSIYRFRHAEVTLLDEAARKITALRPGRTVRQAITQSFRAVPELLAFVNALAEGVQRDSDLDERFTYGEHDRFPLPAIAPGARRDGSPVLGLAAAPSMEGCAAAVAAEVARLLASGVVRDRQGPPRAVRPDDIAILFRARAGHQYFERALEARGIRTYVYKGLGFFDAPEVQDLQALMRYLAQPDSDLRAAEYLRSRLVRLSDIALTRLAPAFAAALGDSAFDAAAIDLDPIDRDLLERARDDAARWLPLADRIPPGELLDLVLRDSAYAFELGGRRLDQARENLKKVRGLVRRVESRGYATLGRLATYFETLRAGDESNAIIGAAGAVNLMTIHAAKGLEFPIVFVVNLHVQGRGRPAGFSVIDRGTDGEPEVAFSSTAGTENEQARETEELRRLLYVAVTRARDRLYLSAEVDQKGRLRRGGRSLAGLLPQGLADTLAQAALVSDPEVEWTSPAGTFAFLVCRDNGERPAPPAPEVEVADVADLVALEPVGRRVRAATETDPAIDRPAYLPTALGSRRDRLTGTAVHRLFQRRIDPASGERDVQAMVLQVVRREELVDVIDPLAFAHDVARLYCELRHRDDVQEALGSGQAYYEVPFSYDPPGRPDERLRGAIDCLVVSPGGAVTILELKTGTPRPEHQAQAEVYRQAMEALFAGEKVTVKILYA